MCTHPVDSPQHEQASRRVGTTMQVLGKYFDGKSARQQAVTLTCTNGMLKVNSAELNFELPFNTVRISAQLGHSPRLLYFSDGGHCEVSDHAGFAALLQQAGLQPQSLLSHLEGKWRHAFVATLLSVSVLVAAFYWGLPWFAQVAAARIPASVALSIDTQFLSFVDKGLMQPSKLTKKRQEKLRQDFAQLRDSHAQPPHRLEFRYSKKIGANAFALPGGTVVATDQLVYLARHDEEILAVLAHELGHVSELHSLRQLLQSSVIGLAMTWYLGDISSLLAAAPTVLLESNYSREFERRADRYAATALRARGISPARLADMLEMLEHSHLGKNAGKSSPVGNENTAWLAGLLSTHPDTAERLRALRSADAGE